MRFVFLFLLISSFAQAQISMDNFLLGVLNDPEIQTFENQNSFLESNPYRLSVIRRLEFRTESNQLDPARQDYALRLNPANPWELKRNNQYFETYQALHALDKGRVLKDAIKLRYESIIDWVYYDQLKTIKENETEITKRLISILEGQRNSSFFNANDYVELKIELMEKSIEREGMYSEIDVQRNRINALHPDAKRKQIDWNINDLISIEAIEKTVADISVFQEEGGEVAYREKKIMLANHEYDLEKANINIGYLQAQYQPYRQEQDRTPWNIALGVTIPIFNPNKGDMAKRKLDIFEAQGALTKAKSEQQSGRDMASVRLAQLVERHKKLQQELEEVDIDGLSATLHLIKDSNPITLVQLERSLMKSEILSARLLRDIHLAYIEFLAYSEILQQQPLKNYLSAEVN